MEGLGKFFKIGIAFACALWMSGGCQAPGVDQGPDIRGTIIRLDRVAGGTDIIGSALIQGVKTGDTQYDQAVLTITQNTIILEQVGEPRRRVNFDALQVGQRVEARFTGPVAESYPVQARAGQIVILH